MSEDLLQQFLDYKAIIELKARFGRFADVKDWAGYRSVFSDDCVFDFGGGYIVEGGQAGTDTIAGMLQPGTVSVHRAYMPEIDFVSPAEARGIWAVNDYIEYLPDIQTGERRGQMGYGREYETYRKIDGEWKIAHWRLRYDRLDPLVRQPLPDTFLGDSDALANPDYVKSVVNPNGV